MLLAENNLIWRYRMLCSLSQDCSQTMYYSRYLWLGPSKARWLALDSSPMQLWSWSIVRGWFRGLVLFPWRACLCGRVRVGTVFLRWETSWLIGCEWRGRVLVFIVWVWLRYWVSWWVLKDIIIFCFTLLFQIFVYGIYSSLGFVGTELSIFITGIQRKKFFMEKCVISKSQLCDIVAAPPTTKPSLYC